ncbi:MAG TPA: thioredoxin domain-containing protein [Candidatus Eisenbacteria bacterium]|nr:thioredoxin domain-containing protein [Candidatus Eisenbacteria bacterium]
MASEKPNRLIHETSPYLLQHAHNPVDWYPWCEEAFEKARRENKPILLSIGYSACHWCHVMERESFENEAIAALMNEHFVNIKVDREERPDLDEIYMNAVQLLTGRGGWPMTVFLTPEGKPFYGGTYFPPEDRYGVPGFPRILLGVASAYREKPHDVQRSVQQILAALERMSAAAEETRRAFSRDTLAQAAERLAQLYDPNYGGFGKAPKFPNPGVYELLLRAYRRSKNKRYLDMVTHTLERMAHGGIYDQLGGGFHRYSVDEKWLVPHFEKMLYDNAQLVRIYAQAFRASGEETFKRVVEHTLAYVLREMRHPEGGFYSTQDADSEGEEGKFFLWTPAEVTRILGDDAGEIFCRIYDVTEEGNFEGKNILHRILSIEQAARLFRRDPGEIEALLRRAREKLFAEREQRVKPFRDEKIIASWNGLMLSGLAAAIEISPAADFIAAAERAVGFFFTRMFRNGRLLHVYKDQKANLLGYLDDYAFMAAGMLDLYEALLDRSYFDRAFELTERMIGDFWDEGNGGFFYTGSEHEALIARSKPAFDGSIPSGNAVAALLLLRLYHYTGKDSFLGKAEKVLRLYYDLAESQPFGFAHMLAALDFYLEKPKEVTIIGSQQDPGVAALLQSVRSRYLPNLTLQLAGPDEALGSISPLLQGKTQLNGKPTAYVCHDSTCSQPVSTPEELGVLLDT